MKIKYFPLLMITFALTISACDSGSDGGGDGNVALGKMEANIDGTQWDASNATANKVTAGGFSILTIAGAKTTNNNTSADAMTIAFSTSPGDNLPTGTYTLGTAPLSSMSFTPGADLTKTFIGTSGTVTITKITDDNVVGTFSFEGRNAQNDVTNSVTSGSFDVKFGVSIGL